MKNTSYLFLALTLLAFVQACATKQYDHTSWNTAAADSTAVPRQHVPLKMYDRNSKLNYDIANDRENLYVYIKTADPLTQTRISRAGMQLAIDPQGKKLFPVSIDYPLAHVRELPVSREEMRPARDPGSRAERRKQAMLSQTQMILSGFREANGPQALETPDGIRVSIDWSPDGMMYYEARIPFKTFYKEQISASDTLKPFNFRITLNALPSMGGEGFAGGPPPGGGGFPGGGGPGGPPPGGGQPGGSMGGMNSSLFVESNISFRMKLSHP